VPALSVERLQKRYGARRAFDAVSFAVDPGRTFGIVGPSGAGKSSLLRAIAGLDAADSGSVRVGERDVGALPPQERRIAMVFQHDALVPQLSVRENLEFARRGRRDEARIDDVIARLHLDGFASRRPGEISGGERQRVSIGRALLSDPDVLLLDEPLAHLDPQLRAKVRDEVVRLRERFAGPIVYVTHDHLEAMSLCDELCVLIDGRIEQAGDPQSVYDAPRNLRVARFFGSPSMNLIRDVHATLGCGEAIVGIRPEQLHLDPAGPLSGTVARFESAGADAYAYVATDLGEIVARVPVDAALARGSTAAFRFDRARVRRYDPITEEPIP